MTVYWIIFLIPSFFAITSKGEVFRASNAQTKYIIYTYAAILVNIIGMRFEVGGDWLNYIAYLYRTRIYDLYTAFEAGMEPGYFIANRLGDFLGVGIIVPNIICALIFVAGLVSFCLGTPRPWLALAVSVPYLVIVVGMGYSRQAAALGFAMLGYSALKRGTVLMFCLYIIGAASFHKSALLLFPLGMLTVKSNRFFNALWLTVIAVIAYRTSLESQADRLITSYIGGEVQSSGALIRLAMNAIPSVIFLVLRNRFIFTSEAERLLWTWISILSVTCLVALMFFPSSSTALDRTALYFLPLQIWVFAQIPSVFKDHQSNFQGHAVGPIIGYYGVVLFVWLNYADNAFSWRNYQIIWFS